MGAHMYVPVYIQVNKHQSKCSVHPPTLRWPCYPLATICPVSFLAPIRQTQKSRHKHTHIYVYTHSGLQKDGINHVRSHHTLGNHHFPHIPAFPSDFTATYTDILSTSKHIQGSVKYIPMLLLLKAESSQQQQLKCMHTWRKYIV